MSASSAAPMQTHVLVVDDDDLIRDMLRDALEDSGYVVEEASDGVRALQTLRASPYPLVVLLDLLMPKLDGAHVLQQAADDATLAARHAYIVMTANGPRIYPALADLPDDFSATTLIVHKPFPLDQLLLFVAEAARRLDADGSAE